MFQRCCSRSFGGVAFWGIGTGVRAVWNRPRDACRGGSCVLRTVFGSLTLSGVNWKTRSEVTLSRSHTTLSLEGSGLKWTFGSTLGYVRPFVDACASTRVWLAAPLLVWFVWLFRPFIRPFVRPCAQTCVRMRCGVLGEGFEMDSGGCAACEAGAPSRAFEVRPVVRACVRAVGCSIGL